MDLEGETVEVSVVPFDTWIMVTFAEDSFDFRRVFFGSLRCPFLVLGDDPVVSIVVAEATTADNNDDSLPQLSSPGPGGCGGGPAALEVLPRLRLLALLLVVLVLLLLLLLLLLASASSSLPLLLPLLLLLLPLESALTSTNTFLSLVERFRDVVPGSASTLVTKVVAKDDKAEVELPTPFEWLTTPFESF